MNEDMIQGGARIEDVFDIDAGGGDGMKLPTMANPNTQKYEYNQTLCPHTQLGCTVFASFGVLSDLFGVRITDQNIWDTIAAGITARWLDPNVGAYLRDAISAVADYWNAKHPLRKVEVIRFRLSQEDTLTYLRLGYELTFAYRGCADYTRDTEADGVLDSVSFGASSYGHAVRIAYTNGMYRIIDNYAGKKKYNTYTIKDIRAFFGSAICSPYGYGYRVLASDVFSDVSPLSPYFEPLTRLRQKGIVNGYDDGSYRSDHPITRGELACILDRIST